MPVRGATDHTEENRTFDSKYVTDGQTSKTTYDRLSSIDHRSFTGEDIINFHAKKKRGDLLPFTNYTKTIYQESATQSSNCSSNDGRSVGSIAGGAPGLYKVPLHLRLSAVLNPPTFDDVTDMFVQAASASIYNAQRHDTLTAALELKKLRSMFLTSFRDLMKLVFTGKNINQSWLSFRYGWRILYYDMINIGKAIDGMNNKRTRFKESAGTSRTVRTENEFSFGTQAGTIKCTMFDVFSHSIRGSVVADIDPPTFSFNVAITAWELITYSFIIDWFIKVGQWLSSLSFMVAQSSHTAGESVYTSVSRSVKSEIVSSISGWTQDSYSLDYSARGAFAIARRPTSVSLLPQTDFGMDFDLYKFQDIISIFSRRVSSR